MSVLLGILTDFILIAQVIMMMVFPQDSIHVEGVRLVNPRGLQ